jgi:hypothetical protein
MLFYKENAIHQQFVEKNILHQQFVEKKKIGPPTKSMRKRSVGIMTLTKKTFF